MKFLLLLLFLLGCSKPEKPTEPEPEFELVAVRVGNHTCTRPGDSTVIFVDIALDSITVMGRYRIVPSSSAKTMTFQYGRRLRRCPRCGVIYASVLYDYACK